MYAARTARPRLSLPGPRIGVAEWSAKQPVLRTYLHLRRNRYNENCLVPFAMVGSDGSALLREILQLIQPMICCSQGASHRGDSSSHYMNWIATGRGSPLPLSTSDYLLSMIEPGIAQGYGSKHRPAADSFTNMAGGSLTHVGR